MPTWVAPTGPSANRPVVRMSPIGRKTGTDAVVGNFSRGTRPSTRSWYCLSFGRFSVTTNCRSAPAP